MRLQTRRTHLKAGRFQANDQRGWISLATFFVVTHHREQPGQPVRAAVGRDYRDVPPARGVFKRNAREKMDVHESVTAL